MSIADQSLDVLLEAARQKQEQLEYELYIHKRLTSDLRTQIIERDHNVRVGDVFESPKGEILRVSTIRLDYGDTFSPRVRRQKKNGDFEERERTLYELCGDNWRTWKRVTP